MEVKLNPGEYLIRERTTCEALYVIKEGQLEVYRTSPSGEKIIVGLISSGEYAGETALFLGTPNGSNVVALTPVTAVRLAKSGIEIQMKTVPIWLIALTRGLIERLHKANEILLRNGITDDALAGKVKAISDKFPRQNEAASVPTPDEPQRKRA